jgi:hypothetical protein
MIRVKLQFLVTSKQLVHLLTTMFYTDQSLVCSVRPRLCRGDKNFRLWPIVTGVSHRISLSAFWATCI